MFLRYLLLVGLAANALASLESLMEQLENNCPSKGDFRCRNSRCVPNTKRCDGKDDCFDGSDEFDCDQFFCKGPLFFKCKNEKCISYVFQCDEENDCGDFSDETDCEYFRMSTPSSANCSKGEWQCSDRLCIPDEWVCNGDSDCLDGSDEVLGCTKLLPCDGFKCKNGHCVPNEWRCDGTNDCNDNSDEIGCENHIDPQNCRFDDRLFLCSNNQTCLQFSQVCDGIVQCGDGSDESPGCRNSFNDCQTISCSHDCFHFPNGPKCLCPLGYRTVNDRTCEDINECEIYGICDQKCRNTIGSYECLCDKKYTLQDDKRTCKAEGGEAMMVFSSKTEIRGYFLQSQVYFPIAKRLKQVVGVGFDGHHIYWTDISSGHESITRSLEDGSNREFLVTSGLGAPEDLAVDWITGNIYFTDSEMQHIGVCTSDGSKCTVLVNKDIDKPRGIALNPAEGEMFWSDWGDNAMIARSLMDGTQDKAFISTDIKWPNGLAIDYGNERLYWVDAKFQTLESVRLDGTDRRIILKGIVKHPYAIAVFENNLYWSDWTTHSIQTCDKFTGKNHKILLKEKKDYIYGIHIFHSALKQPKLDNPCSRSFCSDLHLLSGRGCTCACPQDKILSIDKHVCLASEKRQVLIIGGKNLLAQVEHRMLGTHEMNALPTVAKDIIALAYSPSNGTLFISDASTASIITMNLVSGEESSVLFHADSESRIASLAYDYAGNNLYWCDTKKETVEILSLHTMTRKVLMHDMAGEVPTSIALVPSKGVMFIAFKRTNQGYHIDRFRMDGTGRTHVIDRGLLGPVTLLFEPGLYRIFWTDAGTGMIESTSIQGDDRHIFRSVHTSPISLAALNRDIFWTNEKMKALMWTDKQNTNYDRKITLDLPSDVDSIYIVSATSRPINPHPCHVNNGNCSHLCLASDKTYLCACPLGMNLRPDNVTCYKPLECSVGEFFCSKSDVCIPTSNVCNGHRDCILGDDEEDCPDEPPCSQDEFRCKNGACIKATSVCDLHYDCTDNSDEDSDSCSDYKNGNLCPDGNFRCNSGTCLSNRFLCDGMNDCYDGEDEVDCKFITCSEDQFRCATGSCIPKSWECDKHFDCYDLSDEHAGCEPPPCSSQYFTCKNRRCIDLTLLCDNNDDCGDLSDELKCERTESENPCNITEYRCDDVCLPQSAICNGTVECPQAEDEKDCSNCNIGEFECRNGKCLIREWVCDGVDDCGDASDERNDVCSRKNETVPWSVATSKTSIPCADGYQCKNGNCLDLSLVCNGQEDCYDGSDEHGVCNTSCDTNSNPCDQKCVRTPSGPMCVCHVGYKLLGDGQTCADIKECGREPPICSQLCTEMPGSFVCGCRKGYLLRSDRKSCKSVGDAMSMIFVAGNQIRRLNELDDTLTVLYADETPEITGLDVSVAEDLVYFSIKDTGTIHRLNLKSNTREYMLNAGAPSQLTVDWITQNVYFVDGSGYDGAVKMCNFDRREFATLFKLEGNVQLSAIVVDPINKFLFYAATTWRIFNSPNSMVVRTTLDGAKTTELMKFTKSHVTGLAADPYAKQIYLADQHNGKIHRIDYDGASSALLIASNLSRPYGLNHFEDHLFFKVRGSGFMKKCKLFGDESRVCDIFRMGGTSGDLFAISQISRQPSIENVCAAANCTALCVPAGVGPKCLCPDGSGVPQGQPCIPHPNIVGEETKPTFKKHDGLLRESPKQTSGSAIVGVVGLLLVLLFIGLGYLYMRRRNTGKFDIRMKFYNPLFGMQPPTNTNTETDSERQTVLQPGEHEYCNPVHINKQDMEAATKAILSKVNPLVKIDE